MHTVTIEIPFCAGHRLLGHKGKCRFLHGHNYVAKVSVRRADGLLDEDGMVCDFGPLKEQVKGWIDERWDHNMLLNKDDPLACVSRESLALDQFFGGRPPFVMGYNPTAENMATELLHALRGLPFAANDGSRECLVIFGVTIIETPTCSATYSY